MIAILERTEDGKFLRFGVPLPKDRRPRITQRVV